MRGRAAQQRGSVERGQFAPLFLPLHLGLLGSVGVRGPLTAAGRLGCRLLANGVGGRTGGHASRNFRSRGDREVRAGSRREVGAGGGRGALGTGPARLGNRGANCTGHAVCLPRRPSERVRARGRRARRLGAHRWPLRLGCRGGGRRVSRGRGPGEGLGIHLGDGRVARRQGPHGLRRRRRPSARRTGRLRQVRGRFSLDRLLRNGLLKGLVSGLEPGLGHAGLHRATGLHGCRLRCGSLRNGGGPAGVGRVGGARGGRARPERVGFGCAE